MKRHILSLLSATSLLVACGTPTQTQDPGDCESVEVDGETYCVWRGAILIETGYECPPSLGNLHVFEGEDLAVCSAMAQQPDDERVGRIQDWFTRAPDMMSNNPSPDMSERTCADIETEYRALTAAIDTTCTQDSDCTSYMPDCHLNGGNVACGDPVSAAADLSGLSALETEYDGLSCRAGKQECLAPPCGAPQQPKCENNVCILSFD